MEVHHPHHHSGHIKKKFQEYFTEFIMLFAAVTLGFFAENKREHYVEREREHHYMQTFYEDLKRDTTEMAAVKRHYLKQIANIDTTTSVIFSRRIDEKSIQNIYKSNLGTLGNRGVKLIERTSAQLKNAGGLRLVEDQQISDQIAVYWYWASYMQAYGASTDELKIRAREMSYEIFNSGYYQNMERGNTNNRVASGAKLMTSDTKKLTEYANRLTHIRNSLSNVAIPIIDTSTHIAVGLMKELELKYNLKD
jgi:hypothetical protein